MLIDRGRVARRALRHAGRDRPRARRPRDRDVAARRARDAAARPPERRRRHGPAQPRARHRARHRHRRRSSSRSWCAATTCSPATTSSPRASAARIRRGSASARWSRCTPTTSACCTRATLQPAVDFGRLEQVFVMLHRGPTIDLLYGGDGDLPPDTRRAARPERRAREAAIRPSGARRRSALAALVLQGALAALLPPALVPDLGLLRRGDRGGRGARAARRSLLAAGRRLRRGLPLGHAARRARAAAHPRVRGDALRERASSISSAALPARRALPGGRAPRRRSASPALSGLFAGRSPFGWEALPDARDARAVLAAALAPFVHAVVSGALLETLQRGRRAAARGALRHAAAGALGVPRSLGQERRADPAGARASRDRRARARLRALHRPALPAPAHRGRATCAGARSRTRCARSASRRRAARSSTARAAPSRRRAPPSASRSCPRTCAAARTFAALGQLLGADPAVLAAARRSRARRARASSRCGSPTTSRPTSSRASRCTATRSPASRPTCGRAATTSTARSPPTCSARSARSAATSSSARPSRATGRAT